MIKDDFEYEGEPDPKIWVKFGAPYCRGGLLCLEKASDMVRSKNPVKLDNGASIKLDIRRGDITIEISSFALNQRPSSIPGVPYYSFYLSEAAVRSVVIKNGEILSALLGVKPVGSIEVEVADGKVNFYVSGLDGWGRTFPRTRITFDTNIFQNQDVFIYIIGEGWSEGGQADSVSASSGYENPMYQALSGMSSLINILPIVLFMLVIRHFRSVLKEE